MTSSRPAPHGSGIISAAQPVLFCEHGEPTEAACGTRSRYSPACVVVRLHHRLRMRGHASRAANPAAIIPPVP